MGGIIGGAVVKQSCCVWDFCFGPLGEHMTHLIMKKNKLSLMIKKSADFVIQNQH